MSDCHCSRSFFFILVSSFFILFTFQNYFSINSTTGSVTVHDSADREVAQEYNLQITVTDLNAYDPYPQTATSKSTELFNCYI